MYTRRTPKCRAKDPRGSADHLSGTAYTALEPARNVSDGSLISGKGLFVDVQTANKKKKRNCRKKYERYAKSDRDELAPSSDAYSKRERVRVFETGTGTRLRGGARHDITLVFSPPSSVQSRCSSHCSRHRAPRVHYAPCAGGVVSAPRYPPNRVRTGRVRRAAFFGPARVSGTACTTII